jgi:hypothetical protein
MIEPYWTKPGVRRASLLLLFGIVAMLSAIADFHTPGPARFVEAALGIALLVWSASDFLHVREKRLEK